jgi:UDP-N-acetylmuramoyl-tripeptide--D-alanyl-D-alanine ligase
MKKVTKAIIVAILGWQVRRLRAKQRFTVVAVAGSIGKTSTKFAIATVLGQHLRVRFQKGNYNDIVTIPLVFFGLPLTSLFNPFAWLRNFMEIEKQLRRPFDYDVIVVELGTDGPGQLKQFAKYLKVDIAVVTAITPEHMEFFPSLDDVAREELSVADYSKRLVVNIDLCPEVYLDRLEQPIITYATRQNANYHINNVTYVTSGYDFDILKDEKLLMHAAHEGIAESQLYSLGAAVAIADMLGVPTQAIDAGIRQIKPVSGRMQQLSGANGSLIIDDTYNASPEAVKAALDTLYKLASPQKIAILGNMNELGDYSGPAHVQIGKYCNPKQLALVVTIGPDANKFLAAAAKEAGCNVKTCDTPYEAGEHIKTFLKPGTIVLAKGSQNKVYAEEAVKLLLADPNDAAKLVRQSPEWLAKKNANFNLKNH